MLCDLFFLKFRMGLNFQFCRSKRLFPVARGRYHLTTIFSQCRLYFRVFRGQKSTCAFLSFRIYRPRRCLHGYGKRKPALMPRAIRPCRLEVCRPRNDPIRMWIKIPIDLADCTRFLLMHCLDSSIAWFGWSLVISRYIFFQKLPYQLILS